MIKNTEDIESNIKSSFLEDSKLPVMEAFYTLQGEGYYQGNAAYFIRLGGCDVGCFWCDVKESWDADNHPKKTIREIINTALIETGNRQDVKNIVAVVTGGEPLMHDLTQLTAALQAAGFATNIETSGAHPLSGNWNWICLSPKKFKEPLPETISAANELKIIVYNKSDFDWAEKYASQVSENCKLYLQPEWSKVAEMIPLIVEYIKQHPKWQVSLQIHKYINVP